MNRPPRDFHPLLRVVHLLMAAMVLAMLFIGVGMVSTTGPAYTKLLELHRPVGIAILILVLLRLPLRLATGSPPLPGNLPPMQVLAARGSHVLLYASMAAMPLIGWAMLAAGGYPVELFSGLILPPIAPHDLRLYAVLRQAHTVIAVLFFALILAHLCAALFHGLVRKDGVLRSITVGTRPSPVELAQGDGEDPESDLYPLADDPEAPAAQPKANE